MDVSIVIVSWNTRDMTLECLSSLYAGLNSLRAEVLVVDNASADGSAEAIRTQYESALLIENQSNVGFAAANNQAIKRATGRYVLLLNSDTVVLRNVLKSSVDYMDANGDVAVLGCRVLNSDGSVQNTCFRYPSIFNLVLKTTGLFRLTWPAFFGREHMSNWLRDSDRDVEVVTGCFMMVRHTAIRSVGAFDERFFFCGEETDWCRRFSKAGWKVRFAPVGEIIHHGNASGRLLNAKRDLLLAQGLVRLHRKYSGIIGARAVWCLILVFSLTRWFGWLTLQTVDRKNEVARRRCNHFAQVLRNYGIVWSSE